MRQGVGDLVGVDLLGTGRANGHVDGHVVGGGSHQAGEAQAAVVDGVKDGALGGQRVIQAVNVHAHAHFGNATYESHIVSS